MITPEPPSDTLTDDVVRDDVERTYTEAAQLHVRDRDVFYRFVGAIGGEDWLTGPTRQAHAARRHARALIASLDAVRQDEIGAHLESGAVPDTGQARARGELAAALAADPSLTWDELIYRAFQIRVGASGPRASSDTVQAPDVAARDDDAVVAEAARRLIEASYTRRHDPVLSGGAGVHLRWLASWMHGPRRAEVAEVARALLGTDTTPDRLAWISEAGETAAAERHARYQETACARRPAEEHPDA